MSVCMDCGEILTDAEEYYYENRCENCESIAHQELVAWRNGEENEKFDSLFEKRSEVGIFCPHCEREIYPSNMSEVFSGKHDGFLYIHDPVPHPNDETEAKIH